MKYISTRTDAQPVDASLAILRGIAPDGGLYLPCEIPRLSGAQLEALRGLPYPELCAEVIKLYLGDYSADELLADARRAYCSGSFDGPCPAPVRREAEGRYLLELWHGPTCAFKDMALSILPYLLSAAAKKNGGLEKVVILVATSGDTGKAALEGFKDAPGIKIAVFYPHNGVSAMQHLQMASQKGQNVGVFAVEGNFDDTQTGVKAIFADKALEARLRRSGVMLSSANSINWGRLVPQIVYYIHAWASLRERGELQPGEKLNFVVPTGNFGDILAGYYAKRMGLPIGKLICASNQNRILSDFFDSGVYDANRPFYRTSSPSMDILISSNLERLLRIRSGDGAFVARTMDALKASRRYAVPPALKAALSEDFLWGWAGEDRAAAATRSAFERHGYLMDPHTAVAAAVLDNIADESVKNGKNVIVSTASPYKFCDRVLEALGHEAPADGFEAAALLARLTGTEVPAPIAALQGARVRFTDVLEAKDMARAAEAFALT